MSQGPAHRNDLALVMESMGQHMMQDKRGSTDGGISIGEMKLCVRVELLIRQS